MFKLSLVSAAFLAVAAVTAEADELNVQPQMPPVESLTLSGASDIPALTPMDGEQTKALQSLPFEPTSSLNNNPYEVDCTRHRGTEQTVYYTN